jgi:hypothetical protein
VRGRSSPWPGRDSGLLDLAARRAPITTDGRPMWLCCWRCRQQISSPGYACVRPFPARRRHPGPARRPPSEGLACRSCQVRGSPPIAIDGLPPGWRCRAKRQAADGRAGGGRIHFASEWSRNSGIGQGGGSPAGIARLPPRGLAGPANYVYSVAFSRILGRFQPGRACSRGRRDRRRCLAARCPDPRAPRPAGQPATRRMPVSGRAGRRPAAAARPAARRKAGPAACW